MSSNDFLIRNARPEDAERLAGAEREIAKIPRRLASRPEELKTESFRERIGTLANSASGIYVVIEEAGKLAGHAVLEPHKLAVTSHVVVLTLAIHEGHQGRGLGKALLRYLVEWARTRPAIDKIELQVRSSNLRAIQLYESEGFVEEGRKTRRLKYGPGDYVDDLYMALWVGP